MSAEPYIGPSFWSIHDIRRLRYRASQLRSFDLGHCLGNGNLVHVPLQRLLHIDDRWLKARDLPYADSRRLVSQLILNCPPRTCKIARASQITSFWYNRADCLRQMPPRLRVPLQLPLSADESSRQPAPGSNDRNKSSQSIEGTIRTSSESTSTKPQDNRSGRSSGVNVAGTPYRHEVLHGNTSASAQEDREDILIVVMGATGSGKTTFINLVSGSDLRVGTTLQSCTEEVQTSLPFDLDGRLVTLIDTPGYDDTSKSDTDILKMIAVYLEYIYKQNCGIAGVIYVHRISDNRMGGASKRNFNIFTKLCGDGAMRNIGIVTNMWSDVSKEVGEARLKELSTNGLFFKPALENRARLFCHDGSQQSGLAIIRDLAANRPLPLQIQRELVDEGKTLAQTRAGMQLGQELSAQAEKQRKEMQALQAEMQAALDAKDMESREELEEEYRRLEMNLRRAEQDSTKLTSSYDDERKLLAGRLQTMQVRETGEAEKEDHEYQNRRRALLEASVAQSKAEQELMERRLQDMEARYATEVRMRRSRTRFGLGGRGVFSMVGSMFDRVMGTGT